MLNKGFLFQLQLFLTSYICGTPAGPFYANQSVDVFVWFTPNVLTVGPLNATFTLEALNFLPANATPNVTVYGYLEPELRASQGLTPRCLKSVVNPRPGGRRPGGRGEMETREWCCMAAAPVVALQPATVASLPRYPPRPSGSPSTPPTAGTDPGAGGVLRLAETVDPYFLILFGILCQHIFLEPRFAGLVKFYSSGSPRWGPQPRLEPLAVKKKQRCWLAGPLETSGHTHLPIATQARLTEQDRVLGPTARCTRAPSRRALCC